MRKFLIGVALAGGLIVASPAHAGTKHTIKATARPYKKIGHAIKVTAHGVARASLLTTLAGFDAFDAAVIDPLGVSLQMVADFLDMSVAQPLEKLPEPFEAIGDGVHYVYLGIDKAGQVLAR